MAMQMRLKAPVSRAGLNSSRAGSRVLRSPIVRAAALEAKHDAKAELNHVQPEKEDLPDVQPSAKEVQNFLHTLVTETSIAEMHLQVGTFELKVRRRTEAAAPAAPAYAPPPTVVITQAEPATLETIKTLEETIDESLVPILSPKVGIFRRGKYAAGKRIGKGNAASEGDQVKAGQVLGYVEQLGTFVAVEAPSAGEIVKFLVDEGSPVEYKQEVIELAPFFGGNSKWTA